MNRVAIRRGLAAIVALMLAGTACRKDQPKAAPTPSPSPVVAPALCPLTGTPAPTGVDTARPALAVKIDNAPPARPQAGIDAADIMYEELAEGGITRFIAVFHCGDAARLGPVRSARPVDPDIVAQYKPVLFAYSGARPEVLSKVKSSSGLVDLEHGSHGAAYQRDPKRPAPHNLFTSTDKLRALAKSVQGPPANGFVYETPAAAGASPGAAAGASPSGAASPAPAAGAAATGPGAAVEFAFTGAPDHRYTYDAATGTYLRFVPMNQPFNTESGGQVKGVNLVFLKVRLGPGARAPDFTVTGEGEAIVLRGGASYKGRWTRSGPTDTWKVADASGNPIKLAPGNTWIHLVPETQAVNVS